MRDPKSHMIAVLDYLTPVPVANNCMVNHVSLDPEPHIVTLEMARCGPSLQVIFVNGHY
jgi:hypothetical protein